MESKVRSTLFLFFLTNTTFLTIVAILVLTLSVYSSHELSDWGWFSRSGSILVIIGSTLIFRGTIRLTSDERRERRNMTIIQIFTQIEKEDQENDSRAQIIGTAIAIIGTITWAYGDLINYVF